MIKQESAFDPDATSSAEARGLTQVIPDTGKGIASALKISGFTVEDLYRPHLSVEFGVFYLDNQLDNFKGNPYIALSAYNGGPSNAANWSKANPPENGFDIFVDGISFRETRQYVRIVYTNYAVYRQLYRAR
jgi:soluble lytic murein transglycosylase